MGHQPCQPWSSNPGIQHPSPWCTQGRSREEGKGGEGEAPEPKHQAWGENRARSPQPQSTEPEEPGRSHEVVACRMLQSVGSWLPWCTGAEQVPRCKHQPALCMWRRLSWPRCYFSWGRLGELKGKEKDKSKFGVEKGNAEFIPENGAGSPEHRQQLFFLNMERKI